MREVNDDFTKLLDHINNFKLDNFQSEDNQKFLKSAHKEYFSYLHFEAQFLKRLESNNLKYEQQIFSKNDFNLNLFIEAKSDLSLGFFCSLNGTYKPANMLIRSSIENIIRFLGGIFDKRCESTTSISELFELAKKIPFFQVNKEHLNVLISNYKHLCRHTHSCPSAMAKISSISQFPRFEMALMKEWKNTFSSIIKCIISLFLKFDRSIYIDAHYKTKEAIGLCLSGKFKSQILQSVN
jgi:hypothetical protein